MRLRTVNRLTLVSSAIVASLLAGGGCHPTSSAAKSTVHSAAAPAGQPEAPPAPLPASMPTTSSATTVPSTQATTEATTQATTGPATQAATAPTSEPVIQTATQPASPATTQAVVPAATAPAIRPTTEATPQAATAPTIPPATQAATVPAPASQPATQAALPPATQAVAPPVNDAPPPTDDKTIEADVTLADRIDSLAELEFANKVSNASAWPWIWKHQVALLEASNRLAPKDPRFPRLEADAHVQLHDTDGEINALIKAIAAQRVGGSQTDVFVWNRLLDLHLVKYQTAPEKLKYLDVILAQDKDVPIDVRAHAGFRKAQVLLDRGEDEAANKALEDALTLCPSSLESLQLRYSLLPATATRLQRGQQLLDLLKANPLQRQYSAELADLAADAGLVNESLPWFNLALQTEHRQGDPGIHTMLNLAAELFIGDQAPDAKRVIDALLKIDPQNTQAHFLRVLIARAVGNKDAFNNAIVEASNVLSNRVIEAANAAAPAGTPKTTTRPIDDTDPMALLDLESTVAQLNQARNPELKNQFAEAVADLAMFEAYFTSQPRAATSLVEALQGVVPDGSPEVARLQGWVDLLSQKPDEAKLEEANVKFSSAAAQDPLAELGLIEVMLSDGKEGHKTSAQEMGQQLLTEHASGLLGAILWDRLNKDHIKLTRDKALQVAMQAYPSELLLLIDQPQQVYSIHVDPVHVLSYVGEPLLASVSFVNLTGDDLTIGPGAMIKPELLFQLTAKIGKNPDFSAFDNVAGPMVLPRYSQFTQIVRVDQTQLLAYMSSLPGYAFEVTGTLTSNQVVGGLGGYTEPLMKSFFREASSLTPQGIQATMQNAANGRTDQKITAVSQLELYVRELRSVKNMPPGAQQDIDMMVGAIHHARSDSLPAVAAWASKCEAEIRPLSQAESIVRDMADSPDWRQRQLAVVLAPMLDPATRQELLEKLTNDPQGSVREDVVAVKGLVALPRPTSMPATEPTTEPAALPQTPPPAAP